MTFPSWCVCQVDIVRGHLSTIQEDILRRRIVREKQAHIERDYALACRMVGISARKPTLDELDQRIELRNYR